jgi:flagellar hook-associated protein 1 FlgK
VGDFGINTALTALQAFRQQLDTAGHNIANANTEGYSRQRVDLSSVGGPIMPAWYSQWRGGGGGVQIDGINRMSDAFLQMRSLQEHATQSSLDMTNQVLSRAELTLAEPGDNGLQAQMSDFFSAWDDVANRPDDLPTRTALLEKAQTVSGTFNKIAADLTSLSQSSATQGANQVTQLNGYAAQVSQLNAAIQTALNGGLAPNDLLDQRDVIVGKMAELAGVTTRTNDNGTMDVYIGGTAIVAGRHVTNMSASTTSGLSFTWPDGTAVQMGGGQLGALATAVNTSIPAYIHGVAGVGGLDQLAQQLAAKVNAGQAQGAGLTNPSTPGIAMFTFGDPTNPAATMQLNVNMTPQDVAAATLQPANPLSPPSLQVWDGSNALKLADSGTDVLSNYASFVATIGVDVQRAARQSEIQSTITSQVDASKSSATGVSIDEEMTNMMSAQHAYQAAAKFLSTVNDTLDSLINMVR